MNATAEFVLMTDHPYVKNIEALNEWLRWLEEGRVPQGKGFLKTPEGYCCLGAATEMCIAKEWVSGEWCPEDEGRDSISYISVDLNERYYIPDDVADATQMPRYESDNAVKHPFIKTLAEMNDAGLTFPEIAAFIRKPVMPQPGDRALWENSEFRVRSLNEFYLHGAFGRVFVVEDSDHNDHCVDPTPVSPGVWKALS